MACGFGACFGCVVRTRRGYRRLCVDGPVSRPRTWTRSGIESAQAPAIEAPGLAVDLAGLRLAHPVLNGSGTFDAIAALRTFGDALRERFPFAAFVSKTITVAPRGGNPPPRLWETPAGLINSIGLPNKGLEGFLARDLPELATPAGAPDRERRRVLLRGVRRPGGGGRGARTRSRPWS